MRGLTVIELMVAVAVAAVLLSVAVPSFTYAINSNRLTTTANAVVAALNNAKMAAIQRNAWVQFCSNVAATNTTDTLGTACGTSAGAVFALTSQGAASTVQVMTGPSELDISSIQIHGTILAVRFNGSGQGMTPGTSTPVSGVVVDVCSTSLSTNNHIQVNMATGSIISTSPVTGACP
jgi:type IV fimbrial biogenesis protein FimT